MKLGLFRGLLQMMAGWGTIWSWDIARNYIRMGSIFVLVKKLLGNTMGTPEVLLT